MWLQGQSLFSVNHSDRSRYTLLTLRSTFSHSGFIVFAQRNQMIWMRSLDWSERTAGTGWIQRKDRAFLLLCWDILAQLLTRHSVQLNYWKRTCVEISCCFKLVCVIFFPISWTLRLIRHKKPKQALDKRLLDSLLLFCDSQTNFLVSHFFNSGF